MLKLYVPRFVVRAIIVSFLEFQNSLPRSSTGRPLHPHLTILLYALLLLLTLCVADVTISPTPPAGSPQIKLQVQSQLGLTPPTGYLELNGDLGFTYTASLDTATIFTYDPTTGAL